MNKHKRNRLTDIYDKYGINEGSICRKCCNFITTPISGREVCKCKAYGITRYNETDWRGNYTGCGLYNMPIEDTNFSPIHKS